MLSAVTTVCQRGIMAAGFFQSVSQDRQKIEGAVGVDGLGESEQGHRWPGPTNANDTERSWTDDAAQQGGVRRGFACEGSGRLQRVAGGGRCSRGIRQRCTVGTIYRSRGKLRR